MTSVVSPVPFAKKNEKTKGESTVKSERNFLGNSGDTSYGRLRARPDDGGGGNRYCCVELYTTAERTWIFKPGHGPVRREALEFPDIHDCAPHLQRRCPTLSEHQVQARTADRVPAQHPSHQ